MVHSGLVILVGAYRTLSIFISGGKPTALKYTKSILDENML